jgi:glycosyltransferase involved in cell wall biosynthesis
MNFEKAPIDVCIPTSRNISNEFYYLINEDITGRILLNTRRPLTASRMELIRKVSTPYFAFLDDDIRYKRGLLRKLYWACSKENWVGAVQGRTVPYGLGEKWDNALRPKSHGANEIVYIQKGDHKRFMTSNAVIKTELVRDWRPKPSYSGCEDWHLTNHILNKNYTVVILPLDVPHLRTWKKVRSNSDWFSKAYISIFGKRRGLIRVARLGFGILKYAVMTPNNPRLSVYTMYQNTFAIGGLLRNLI